jgi:hypothetical protein
VQSKEFKVMGLGFGVKSSGFRVQRWVNIFGFVSRLQSFGRVEGTGAWFRVQGLGLSNLGE